MESSLVTASHGSAGISSTYYPALEHGTVRVEPPAEINRSSSGGLIGVLPYPAFGVAGGPSQVTPACMMKSGKFLPVALPTCLCFLSPFSHILRSWQLKEATMSHACAKVHYSYMEDPAKLECPVSQDFTVENVLSALPAFPKGAPQQRAKRAAEALVKAANYSRLMALQQIEALEAELDFHRSIYSLQVQYSEALFQGIKQAYHNFQENVVTVICCPLNDILSSYSELKMEGSEAALRNFLTIFKNNVEQIQDAVDTLTPSKKQQHEGNEAISKLGKDFFLALESSLKICGEKRDKSALEIATLKHELDKSLETLSSLKKERKPKGSSKDSTRSEVESLEGTGLSSADPGQERDSEKASRQLSYRRKHSQPSLSTNDRETIDSLKSQEKKSSLPVPHQRSKSLQRSKSVKNPSQPPWQD
ncbi:Hypothetical predicted protein [Pelobates cultripes]|uniref:Uncharacterized protein n=1 Tax=Pelobates cultripes TaxID=61616 RepID=A0AAD1SC19_PELCU|nr:Hypothetical predicted protein [Pelobates cultripes]